MVSYMHTLWVWDHIHEFISQTKCWSMYYLERWKCEIFGENGSNDFKSMNMQWHIETVEWILSTYSIRFVMNFIADASEAMYFYRAWITKCEFYGYTRRADFKPMKHLCMCQNYQVKFSYMILGFWSNLWLRFIWDMLLMHRLALILRKKKQKRLKS